MSISLVFQWVPITGIFLMFLLAPIWSVVLVNLGFVAVIFDIRAGTLPRWTLVFPIAYFGGYYGLMLQEHVTANRQTETFASRTSARLFFDPDTTAIEVGRNGGQIVHDLLVFYGVPRAIRKSSTGSADVFKWDASCKSQPLPKNAPEWEEEARHSLTVEGCITTTKEAYDGPTAVVSYRMIPGRLEDAREIIVTAADGSLATINDDAMLSLAWFPIPMIGCGLVYNSSSWSCTAKFGRARVSRFHSVNGVNGQAIAVADVLGLKRSP